MACVKNPGHFNRMPQRLAVGAEEGAEETQISRRIVQYARKRAGSPINQTGRGISAQHRPGIGLQPVQRRHHRGKNSQKQNGYFPDRMKIKVVCLMHQFAGGEVGGEGGGEHQPFAQKERPRNKNSRQNDRQKDQVPNPLHTPGTARVRRGVCGGEVGNCGGLRNKIRASKKATPHSHIGQQFFATHQIGTPFRQPRKSGGLPKAVRQPPTLETMKDEENNMMAPQTPLVKAKPWPNQQQGRADRFPGDWPAMRPPAGKGRSSAAWLRHWR